MILGAPPLPPSSKYISWEVPCTYNFTSKRLPPRPRWFLSWMRQMYRKGRVRRAGRFLSNTPLAMWRQKTIVVSISETKSSNHLKWCTIPLKPFSKLLNMEISKKKKQIFKEKIDVLMIDSKNRKAATLFIYIPYTWRENTL